MRSYGPTPWLDYYDRQVFLYTGYYTSHYIQLESKLPDALHCMLPSTRWSTLLIALDFTPPACSNLPSQLLSMAHSQPALTYAPNLAIKTLPSTLQVHFQVHIQVCSQVHCWACSQRHSQLHLMAYISKMWISPEATRKPPRLSGRPHWCSQVIPDPPRPPWS